ncbi:MAG: DUF692 domain-containing protein [Polyangiales bacterium]
MLGYGIGLRTVHYEALTALPAGEHPAGLDWLEAITENHIMSGGRPRAVLRALRARFPIALHGVSLSIGSTDPLDVSYLRALGSLVREIDPVLVSDHLCWTSVGGHHAHDLLPLPLTEEALAHVAARVAAVQDLLKRPIALENVSSYLRFADAEMTEWEFAVELVRRSGCLLLLDVNNVFVSAYNHGFDPALYIGALPTEAIAQVHLAGHTRHDDLYVDTHDRPVDDEVWDLYRCAVACHGPIPTCIEWDDDVPQLARLVAESARAAQIAREVTHVAAV